MQLCQKISPSRFFPKPTNSPIRMRGAESRHQFHESSLWLVCDICIGRLNSSFWEFCLCYMLKTGTLSYKEFENELLNFTEIAKNIQDSWNLEFSKVRSLIQLYAQMCKGRVQMWTLFTR